MTLSLPSCWSARWSASIEPRASPSGFSCVWLGWDVWGELIDEFRHAHAALDRRIVLEGQLGGPAQPELAVDAGLQEPAGGSQTLERPP
jgi:hypothetical protein